MVLPSGQYATICSEGGAVLAQRAEIQEREVTEVDRIHRVITALLTENQASKMIVGVTDLIRISSGKTGYYRLMHREDENLPLRRHTYRSEARS